MDSATQQIIPVILSGGVGSRLWPVSRKQRPKPFMKLPDGDSLMSKTLKRALKLNHLNDILTVTNRDLYFTTKDEIVGTLDREGTKAAIAQHYILEPCGRNTAPAILAAALRLNALHGEHATMLVMAADHLIRNEDRFIEAVEAAKHLALDGELVTFGIKPTAPETGYGYIKALVAERDVAAKVHSFVEKPDLDTAKHYLETGEYFWNAGIFCFTAGTLIREMTLHAPDVFQQVERAMSDSQVVTYQEGTQLELDQAAFSAVQDISIDYALFERSQHVSMVPCDIGWSDIGSWGAWSDALPRDIHQNQSFGDVLSIDSSNTFVHSPHALTATLGVEDLIIINTEDALLVAHKSAEQEVRKIVTKLSDEQHPAQDIHQTVHRPWGSYTTLEEGERFKIKRIIVKPGRSLSLQMHHHRSEHWVVVSGMANIVNGEQSMYLNCNESTFITAGRKHRLENPGLIDLVLIEVQSGDYLGEDDIVRFDDEYGRIAK
ncbi:Alginate biosynthesis protein AlgA [Marinomonas gallaica]|uniref:mannose-1-phosphate guanylyltransferase n=1 Tax=Marinomonas gallaica TaxID=1806667 RepID=A0A1C3JUQ4_9GAMM|nr:mannose-1-phosphate guanylyltransferase/mannose-6-phosphate isomerase [Marinomonas gallaica]SBT18964.1 Alginate biosynthesis protein AlgA [Marinomonas gallaica]SBT21919.1 Alginate biosynthesis protein AlgA [Marinomonas gallaica]